MSISQVLEKYKEATTSDTFAKYEKGFSDKIVSALSKGYVQQLCEPCLVRIVEDVVNSVRSFNDKGQRPYFELSTKSIFIHGNKSHVRFKYYGNWIDSIELGDLIFIISIVYQSKKYFEKITINQFKRDKNKPKSTSWGITNKKQLYFLSRFPAFEGVKGLIPKKTYYLPNHSGCLGSYGLLHKPGDFAFVSATRLNYFIGDRTTLKMTELYNLVDVRVRHPFQWWGEIFYPWIGFILGNCHFSNDVFSFVHDYLRASIGEPVFTRIGVGNPQVRLFLDDLMSAIKSKGKREKSEKMQDFVNEFRKFSYVDIEDLGRHNRDGDFDGGGIGIIHTTIDLGE